MTRATVKHRCRRLWIIKFILRRAVQERVEIWKSAILTSRQMVFRLLTSTQPQQLPTRRIQHPVIVIVECLSRFLTETAVVKWEVNQLWLLIHLKLRAWLLNRQTVPARRDLHYLRHHLDSHWQQQQHVRRTKNVLLNVLNEVEKSKTPSRQHNGLETVTG